MRPIAKAVVKAGLVSKESITEFKRWGLPVDIVEETDPLDDLDQVVSLIREALEQGEQVRIQESDLDVLRRWLDPTLQRKGTLTIKQGRSRPSMPIVFCTTLLGEYVIPWKSESIRDSLIMGDAYITADGEDGVVSFSDVREVYFGDQRAFMICTVEYSRAS